MTEPIALVTRTAQNNEEVHKSVLETLEEALEGARRGDIKAVCILIEHPNGNWSGLHSGTMDMSRTIGQLEMTKQEWIRKYMDDA